MFIQIIQGKCSRQDELRAMSDRWRTDIGMKADGWLGGTYGFTDDGQFVAVVRFESKEAAMANSGSEVQSAWWAQAQELFDGPVEFHDCDKVMLMMDGGSDEAGFVQVIRGRIDDPDRLETDLDKMTAMLHEMRPDILGATLAIESDGTFTETVAFTDESAAREGEMREMPITDEVRSMWQEWGEVTRDVKYLDLHHPWFSSRV